MKRWVALTAAAALLGGCEWLTGDFRLSGTVEITHALESHVPATNAVLFVIAENTGGVPLAVHRIVNPEFPAKFSMGPQDLLVPGIRSSETLIVIARLNGHGNLGIGRPGDLEGQAANTVRRGDRGVVVKLDKIL